MRTIMIRGMHFRVVEQRGKGKVSLVLINGMRMEQGVYNLLRRRLGAPTISFDFPEKWKPGWRYAISPMWDKAHAVSLLITELGYEQVDLLGVSWGGALAIEFAMLYPDKVRRLVLVSTTARPLRLLHPAVLLAYFTKGYGGKSRTDAGLLAEVKSGAGSSPIRTDLYRGFTLPFWFGASRLPFVGQETLIVSGDDDTITPQSEARFLQRWIPNSRLELVSDGHLAVYSSAVEVAEHINPFLAEKPTITRHVA
jgi:poly(3-hydroxyoctanoate) depolymerase